MPEAGASFQGESASRLPGVCPQSGPGQGPVGINEASGREFGGTHDIPNFQPYAKQMPCSPEARPHEIASVLPSRAVLGSPLIRHLRDLIPTEALGVFQAHSHKGVWPKGPSTLCIRRAAGETNGPRNWTTGFPQVHKLSWGYLEYLLNVNLFT